ncbi:cupin domain-containing protein [Thalassococcus lentus]|uniref:Cupin domain-containing protein n=1 Tax=Thalassococcus lentus TaxID=1210524 RepID=A0ABT4XRK2_9RHOB|nr:cupin domain-containing protein [Thalassococcus lentus]MDA7424578.1 cupin domain-containing protein [Thalassococcus lentus]
MSSEKTAEQVIEMLDLQPHPEGGHYRQTWIDDTADGRPAGTCIYFLLKGGERNLWHRVDATEIWHHYAGAPLVLSLSETEKGPRRDLALGPDLTSGERPQLIVPAHFWQAVRSTGDWTLVGCTVSPGFQFEGFELKTAEFDIP